jgi:hypothetical protein
MIELVLPGAAEGGFRHTGAGRPGRRWMPAGKLPRCLPVVLALLLGAAPPAARPGATVELKGRRQVRVEVGQGEGNYLLHARMPPVSSFDEATNARLNRDRARQCALLGLARHLAGGGRVQLEVAGARVVRTGREGKFYTLTLSVPQAGVKRVEGRGAVPLVAEPGKPVRVDPFAAPFFTRKSDHLLTLAQVASALTGDLREASKKKKPGRVIRGALPREGPADDADRAGGRRGVLGCAFLYLRAGVQRK